MRALLDQIDVASGSSAFYLALMGALTVPDVAGALGHQSGEAHPRRYEAWVRENLSSWQSATEASALYQYRNSMLHQQRAKPDPRKALPRLLFREPAPDHGILLHHVGMGEGADGALVIDVREFCAEMTAAARQWLARNLTNPVVLQNYVHSVRRHDKGLKPFIVGIPVIG